MRASSTGWRHTSFPSVRILLRGNISRRMGKTRYELDLTWLDIAEVYLTSLPLVSVRRHGHVNFVKVEIKCHLECKPLAIPCTQLQVAANALNGVALNYLRSMEARVVSFLANVEVPTLRRAMILGALLFAIWCSIRWLNKSRTPHSGRKRILAVIRVLTSGRVWLQ